MLLLLRLSNSSKTPEENTQGTASNSAQYMRTPDATLRPHPSFDRIHTPSITAEILPLLDSVSFHSTGLLLRGFGWRPPFNVKVGVPCPLALSSDVLPNPAILRATTCFAN